MYIPIIKTGEAEIKAVEQLTTEMLDQITPIIELTRGRQKTLKMGDDKIVTFPFDKRFARVKEVFKGRTIFLDLTSDDGLLSNEVYELYSFENGYKKWCDFVKDNTGEKKFGKVIPSVLFNWSDNEFENNFSQQVNTLADNCGALMYRSSIQTKDCYDELPIILNYLPKECELWIVLDGGYLQDSVVELAYNRCKKRIQNIKEKILGDKKAQFVIAATSYPERVLDYGNDNPIVFYHSEVKIHRKLKTDFPEIAYGDYAGTNPIRKDLIVMARGWIPRIDIPLKDKTKVYWKRRPQGVTEYKGTYISVSMDVVADPEFSLLQGNTWGVGEILSCADGSVPSCAPAFWISVRMFNHIHEQLIRLESESK